MEHEGSPRPWTYRSEPSRNTSGNRDWIEDANGNIVVEHVGHIDGPLIVAAVNAIEKISDRRAIEHTKLGELLLDKSPDGNIASNWQGGRVNGLGVALNIIRSDD